MVVDPFLTPVATWALGKAADTVWTLATDQVQATLQKTDVEQAIKAGLEAVRVWEQSLEVPALLFKRCDDKQKRQFLEQVFTDAGVVEQLQRPLVGNGEPDVGLLQAYVEQVAKDKGIDLTLESLPPWLQIFSATYVEKTALFIKYEVARRRYLQQLANWYDDVKFLGISVAGQEDTKSEKLLQIFVMPDVKQRSSLPTLTKSPANQWTLAHELGHALLDEKSFNGQELLLAEQKHLAEIISRDGKILPANQIFYQTIAHRAVLLGAPGSGKTTLMSYFAVALATEGASINLGLTGEYLPILVRIRDWVRSTHTNLLDYVRWFATDKLAVKDLPTGFFEHWLEAGKALILLDGLDEVASEARRDEVVNQIECFLQHDVYRHNPAIITSRPAGYKQAYFRTEEFPHYDLQPFDPKKIDQFIQNWYDNRFQDREESQRRQQTLKKALSEQNRIQVLAKNPLLLTIIALIHRYEAYLPRDRHQLYNRAVETLLTNWDANKETDYKWPMEYIKRDSVRRIMEQLAYWIHSYDSAGDAEGGTLIDRDELIRQLGGFIAEEAGIKRYQAEAESQRFLDHIRERTGLLNEQGQDCYAFVHKTFQEYLCAQEIKYRADEEYDLDLILTPIRDHLHKPHWEEVLLLLIAQQPKKMVAKIIQQILNHPAPYEQWLHRNLFFAAACLAEDVKLANTELIEHILSSLVDFIVAESPMISEKLQEQATKCLYNLGETAFQEPALQFLESRQDKIKPFQFQQFRFTLGQEDLAIIDSIALLTNGNERSRSSIWRDLDTLSHSYPNLVKAIINRLNDDSSDLPSLAANILRRLGQSTPELVQPLINGLSDDDWFLRSNCARSLGNIGKNNSTVVQTLITCLHDKNPKIRSGAAQALGYLGTAGHCAIQDLIACLTDPVDGVCFEAAGALGKIGQVTPEVTQALIDCLGNANFQVRIFASDALGQLGQTTPDIVQALTDRLKDKNKIVSYRAAEALGELDIAISPVIQKLTEILKDDDVGDYYPAVEILGKLSSYDLEAKNAIIDCLEDSACSARSSLAEALAELGNVDSNIIQALATCLKDPEISVRCFVAGSLSKLTTNPSLEKRLMYTLIDCMKSDDYLIAHYASESLGKLDGDLEDLELQLVNWIEQNQQSDYVCHGIDALWMIMTEQV